MKRILIIGNSHSCDAFWQLQEVFKAEAPEENVLLGIVYYSGCRISQHIQFSQNHQNVYIYYRNAGSEWEKFPETTMEYALQDQAWDIIFLQPGRPEEEYTKELRDTLARFIAQYVKNPYQLMWHQSWPAPNDETFYSPTYDPQPPANYRERVTQMFGFDPVNQANIIFRHNREKVLGDPMFVHFLSTSAAIMHAHLHSGVPQVLLWRDYTHLSDYGRLIASYAIFTQLTGKTLTEVKVNSIAADLRHRRARVLGDMEVTEEMKQVILAAIEYAKENPWTVPCAE